MARIRSIKPDFWNNERVLECSPIARLMFIGMWNFADDTGRMKFSPKTIKAQIFPLDDISVADVAGMIDELSSNGLIQIYYVDTVGYLYILGWAHQKIDRPQKSKCPNPPEYSPNDRRQVATDLRGSDRIGGDKEKKDGAAAPVVNLFPKDDAPPSEEKSYFDRFKEICGSSSGGLAAKLKNHMLAQGKHLSDARAAVETAASKSNPKQYIGRILNQRGPDRPGREPDRPGMVYGDDYA